MKTVRYLAFGLLIIEGVVNLFPQIFRPIMDLELGIITIGQFLGMATLFLVLAIIIKKEQGYEKEGKTETKK
jgi:hypothetical protein